MCRFLVTVGEVDDNEFGDSLSLMERGGPDYTKIIKKNSNGKKILMGHNRLAIIDLDDRSAQPMVYSEDDSEYILVFNGELYNFKDLSEFFTTLETTGDTEVLLRFLKDSIDENGYFDVANLSLLNGEMSFVFITPLEIIAHRDSSGTKPLYIHDDEFLAFSSEIRPITELANLVPDMTESATYMEYGFNPGKGTPFKEISSLFPGDAVVYNLENGIVKYHQISRDLTIGEKYVSIEKALRESVKERLVADVPISLTLSGGLDSSILCYLMKDLGAEFTAYCLTMEGMEDEYMKAKKVADHYKVPLVNIVITAKEILENIDDLIYRIEEPIDKGSLIPTYFLAKGIKEKVTLIGEGADECFGGYNRHAVLFKKGKILNIDAMIGEFYRIWDTGVEDIPTFNKLYDNLGEENYLTELDLSNEIPFYHCMRIDKMMMSFGIEARVPFLDKKITSIGMITPEKDKIEPPKNILREAFRGKIPDWILDTPKSALKIPFEKLVILPEIKNVIQTEKPAWIPKWDIDKKYDELGKRNNAKGLWLLYLLIKVIKTYK